MGGKHVGYELAKQIREEYASDDSCTYQYLADKYDKSLYCIYGILRNKVFCDPDYVPVKKKHCGSKRKVYIPEETILLRDTPMTTLYDARGHNHVIHVAK